MRTRLSLKRAFVLATATASLQGLLMASGGCTASRLPPSPRQPGSLREAAIPLLSTDPNAGESQSDDLKAIGRWLGSPKVVGLGEDPHGTHTLHRLCHRLFEHLVAAEGFTVLALETDQAHAALLDAFVQGERDDLQGLLAQGWWGSKSHWDVALVELLEWMRDHNRRSGKRLHVAGYDHKQPALAAQAVVAALAGVDPAAAREAEALYTRALSPGAFGLFPNVSGFTATLRIPLPTRSHSAPLVIELETRAEDLTYGSVGIAAEVAGDFHSQSLKPGDLATGWSPLRLELNVPAEVSALELSLWHRGNGTVWVTQPRLTVVTQTEAPGTARGELTTLAVQPLMMPALQAMDYRHEFEVDSGGRGTVLRVVADPLLDDSRVAAAAAEELVAKVAIHGALDPARRIWVQQAARLVSQAVAWRTLAENNRDRFLAENLRWLHEQAFPEARMLALGHASHTERRQGRMGAFLSTELGADYGTISMIAGAGSTRYFGEVSRLAVNAPLVVQPVEANPFRAALAKLRDGSYLLPLARLAATTPGLGEWLASSRQTPEQAPDIVIFVEAVEPIRQVPAWQ